MGSERALFLDLDGTIIQTKSGNTFPDNMFDWKFNKNILDKIKEYYEGGYKRVYIVTNQGGIEDGYVDELEFRKKITIIRDTIEVHLRQDIYRDGKISFMYADTTDSDNELRKPNAGMLDRFTQYYPIDPSISLMVGDMDTDKQAAANVKLGTIPYMDINTFLTTCLNLS